MSGGYAITDDGAYSYILMRCPIPGCEADGDGTFWAEMGEDYVDDHFGGHSVLTFPEDAPCPACGAQGVEVEV